MHREGIFESHRLDPVTVLAAAVGGSPQAEAKLGPVPQGYAWYLENVAYSITGSSHTAALDLVITPDDTSQPANAVWDHAGLVWTTPAAVRGFSGPGAAYYAGPGHWIHAVASGGTLANGDVLTVTFQVAVHQLDPSLGISSPVDQMQARHAAAHHAGPQEDGDVATAGRRAY